MQIPQFLKKGDTICSTAISSGLCDEIDKRKINFIAKNLKSFGLNLIETPNVRSTEFFTRSSDAKTRAKEFINAYCSKSNQAIIFARGGDMAYEILDYLDFDVLKNASPKWIQGYSDCSQLLFLLTTICEIATMHFENLSSYSSNNLNDCFFQNMALLFGKETTINSYPFFQNTKCDKIIGNENLVLDTPTNIKTISGHAETIEGCVLGGCLDVLQGLIGTKYDKVNEFVKKHSNDGILWFFDNFALSNENVSKLLWQMNSAGWFENAKGFVFGRTLFESSTLEMTFEQALQNSLSNFNLPIVYDADFGHKSPQMPVVFGINGIFKTNNGKSKFKQKLI